MNQLTIRGVRPELQRRINEIALKKGLSLNKAAIYLLEKGAGICSDAVAPGRVGEALDEFFGVWSEEDEAEFLESIKACEQVDEAFWE